MIARGRARMRSWRAGFDPLALHPLAGSLVGLVLVVVLVPLLYAFRGEEAGAALGPSIPLLFLVPVLLASALGGRRAGVLVSVVAILVWDWYFIPPLYTITIASARDVLALAVFLVVALLVGQLAIATRRRTEEALRRARSSAALYDLSLALIAHRDLADVLRALTERLRTTFDLEAGAVLLADEHGGGWRTAAAAGHIPSDLAVEHSRDTAAVAGWVAGSGQTSWRGQMASTGLRDGRLLRPHVRQSRAQFLPLRVGGRAAGVLELVYRPGMASDPARDQLLATFANGMALALEQARLAQEEQAATVARESDRLKSALLSSVSHDLRTPLAGIKAAASSLLQQDVQWSDEDRRVFLTDIDHEADRLTRLVSNLLDLSRIEAGAIQPQKEWTDVGELIERVSARLEPRLGHHPLTRVIPATLPLARLDAVQIEQVLTNLLENAAKYSPPSAPITVTARVSEQGGGARTVQIAVMDWGPGISPSEQVKIFDKFYRVANSARRVGGTGMGLSIVKGLVEAHGGWVNVESTPGQGSTFTVTVPLEQDDGRARATAGAQTMLAERRG